MRARLAQYSNEFVSLTVMALMSIALVAGQAGATQAPADESTLDVVLVHQALRDGEPCRRLALGFLLTTSWAVALALTTLTFELALFGQAKAAYALLLTAPAALAFALGYRQLDAALPDWARAALAGWLSAFVGALFLGFAG